jgi:hypothetical protein
MNTFTLAATAATRFHVTLPAGLLALLHRVFAALTMNALDDLSLVALVDIRHPAFRHYTNALQRDNHRVARDLLGLPHEDFAQTKARVAKRRTGT